MELLVDRSPRSLTEILREVATSAHRHRPARVQIGSPFGGDDQFLGRAREALTPSRGFEGFQRVQRWQAAHQPTFHRKTHHSRKTKPYPSKSNTTWIMRFINEWLRQDALRRRSGLYLSSVPSGDSILRNGGPCFNGIPNSSLY